MSTQGERDISLPARTNATTFSSNAWRNALATGVASAALFAYGARPVRAQGAPPPPCVINPTDPSAVDCTGDLSGGVTLNNGAGPFNTLNVFDLTTNVGSAGIEFTSVGGITINSETGPFAIVSTATGIFGDATGSGNVTIANTGDIRAAQDGILGRAANGNVIIGSTGQITTTDDDASGIHADAANGSIAVASMGNITTQGEGAYGIFTEGSSQLTAIASFGNIVTSGDGAAGIRATSAGDIGIASFGDIDTAGVAAVGIFATQSGGDRLGIASFGDISTLSNDAAGIYAFGADYVGVDARGAITTQGDGAPGIVISAAGDAVVLSRGNISTGGYESPGVAARAQGNVSIGNSGAITTTGEASYGILGYSTSGNVSITNRGDIFTTGEDAVAIQARALGQAYIVNFGNISATGDFANGIFAGGLGGNTVINYGTIQGCPCAGVVLMSVAVNQLTNFGTITAVPGGEAIDGSGSSNRVDNYGTVTGNVILDGGPSNFYNHAGASFNTGVDVETDIDNSGTIAPGGQGAIETTVLTGSIVQNAGGIFAVDIDGAFSDQIVDADTADLAGNVAVRMLSLPLTAAQTYTILTTTSGADNDGLGLIASPALHATLQFTGNDVVLGISIDFTGDGLNPNQRGAGHNRRVQLGSAIRHGETDALEVAGRQPASVYRRATMYTTMSPCHMCTGAILLYAIPRVVLGENRTFMGAEDLLREHGVEVVNLDSEECYRLMQEFIAEHPELWFEDIGEESS